MLLAMSADPVMDALKKSGEHHLRTSITRYTHAKYDPIFNNLRQNGLGYGGKLFYALTCKTSFLAF